MATPATKIKFSASFLVPMITAKCLFVKCAKRIAVMHAHLYNSYSNPAFLIVFRKLLFILFYIIMNASNRWDTGRRFCPSP